MLRKLFFIILVIIAIYFGYQFAKNKQWLPSKFTAKIDSMMPKNIKLPWQKDGKFEFSKMGFSQKDFENLGENGLKQVNILAEKAKEAGGVTQGFVQQVVKEDKGGEKNISEKALEYGKYIYCQEVVKQYQINQSTSF